MFGSLPGADRRGAHRAPVAHVSGDLDASSPPPPPSRRDRLSNRRRNLTAVFAGALVMGLGAQVYVLGINGAASAATANITPLTPGKTLSGVTGGGGQTAVNAFGKWRGRTVDVVTNYLGTDTWTGITNVAGEGLTKYWDGSTAHRVYSVPMLPLQQSASLTAEANGDYNSKFKTVAQALINGGDGSSTIRLGWEMTGDWYPWYGGANPSAFISAWRQIVTSMRSVSGAHFTFDFNVALHNFDPSKLYPGDAYVDLIGADNYDDSFSYSYPATDHVKVWAHIAGDGFGLDWLGNFAKSHGKRMSFPEWGVSQRCDGHSGGDDPYFMQQFHNWMASHDVAYETYSEFAENSCRNFILTSGAFPKAAALYQKLSSGGAITTPTPTTTTKSPTPTATTTKPTPTTTKPTPTTTKPTPTATTKSPTPAPTTTKPPVVSGSLDVHSVLASANANRSGSWVLQGSTISGTRYLFVNPPSGTTLVRFYLDRSTSSSPNRTETSGPWDFSGTNGSVEKPWNASGISKGKHTLIVLATVSGSVKSVTVTFTTS